MLHIRQNYLAASVLGLEEFQGVPVLIHKAGYYHAILGDDGNRIDRYIGVSVLGKIFHVSAYFGYGDNGRMVAASVGVSNTLEASRSFFPRAVVGIDEAAALYAKARDIWTKNMPWAQPLSRQDYETLADQLGFDPQPDKELSIWSDFTFPQYSLDDLPRVLTHQRRAYSVKRETDAATVAKAAATESMQPCGGHYAANVIASSSFAGRKPG